MSVRSVTDNASAHHCPPAVPVDSIAMTVACAVRLVPVRNKNHAEDYLEQSVHKDCNVLKPVVCNKISRKVSVLKLCC